MALRHLAIVWTLNWRASLKKFCWFKVLLIQFFPALSVMFLLVYAKCNFASVSKLLDTYVAFTLLLFLINFLYAANQLLFLINFLYAASLT